MKHIIKVEVLENLPGTRPLIAMDATGKFFQQKEVPGPVGPPSNEIWYISSDRNIVTPYKTSALPEIDTNTYVNGKGIIKFKTDVTSIGNNAFKGCSSLTSVRIGNSVTSIGRSAFSGCTGLTSVTIPNSVTSIGNSTFYNCSGLTTIEIPNSVANINRGAFNGCNSLAFVHISDIAAWCAISFEDDVPTNPLYYANNLYLNNELVTNLIIPNSVTSIGSSAFCNCSSLTSVTIPNSVTSIGSSAFEWCTSLTSVVCETIMPPTLDGFSVFYQTNDCPIYVPAQSIDEYKAAIGWAEYADRIRPIK